MLCGRRLMGTLLRPGLCGVLVVLCCLVGSLRTADASCGDHLVMPWNHTVSNPPTGWHHAGLPQTSPSRLPVPCHGPECRGLPSLPSPADVPTVSSPFRQVFVPTELLVLALVNNVDGGAPNDGLPLHAGFRQRLDRPPEGC